MHALEPELRRLSKAVIILMWTDAMRRTSEQSREKVLISIRAFAPILVYHLGSELASILDEAIRVGARDIWP
jgi:hypothetical protein